MFLPKCQQFEKLFLSHSSPIKLKFVCRSNHVCHYWQYWKAKFTVFADFKMKERWYIPVVFLYFPRKNLYWGSLNRISSNYSYANSCWKITNSKQKIRLLHVEVPLGGKYVLNCMHSSVFFSENIFIVSLTYCGENVNKEVKHFMHG